jgi:hypothetical protein
MLEFAPTRPPLLSVFGFVYSMYASLQRGRGEEGVRSNSKDSKDLWYSSCSYSTFVCMDQVTIKTPNPKCCLYWCLIEIQSVMYFRPVMWTSNPLTFSLVHLPPPPFPVWRSAYRGMYLYSTVCNGEGGRDRVVWRASGVIHCQYDQIPNLHNCIKKRKNCFTTPNKNLGGEGASDR